jgi:glutaredoxin-related protein
LESPIKAADPDPAIERLDKLLTYYDHFEVEERYGINFKQFVRKVDEGAWEAYLA